MHVFVNDEPTQVQAGITIARLVDMLGNGRRGVAVAVAAEVVPRSAWERVELADGDRVEVLRAVQGGCC
ncbi:MAG: sulfur carrier protein ThiS [Actinomycetota bacterium]|nr:sulfur carrier protein ThiS [Actinomycetota bacterium]